MVGLATIFVGFVPIGLGIIVAVTSDELASPAIWLLGISPLCGPFYASGVALPQGEMPIEISRALPGAFWFWRGLLVLVAGALVVRLVRERRAVAQQSLDEDGAGGAGEG